MENRSREVTRMDKLIIDRASNYMTPEDAKRMADLKAEYSKLTTKPARMSEIYEEMKALRRKAVGQ